MSLSGVCINLVPGISLALANFPSPPSSTPVQHLPYTNQMFVQPAIVIGITTILARCSFRVAELSEGFKGELANNEVLYMIFEAVMMAICVLVLTVGHPGLTLGSYWNTGKFHWRQSRAREVEKQHQPQRQATTTGAADPESYTPSSGESLEQGETNKENIMVR